MPMLLCLLNSLNRKYQSHDKTINELKVRIFNMRNFSSLSKNNAIERVKHRPAQWPFEPKKKKGKKSINDNAIFKKILNFIHVNGGRTM